MDSQKFQKYPQAQFFGTESVSDPFKLTYPNLFENIFGYLNPVTFFHFAILSD